MCSLTDPRFSRQTLICFQQALGRGRALSFKWRTAIAVIGIALPCYAQYAGPAMLSRGEAPNATVSPEVEFRPFVEVSGVYNTGLATVGVTDQGQLATAASSGMMLTWGISGTHGWKHTTVGLDYRGSLTRYARQTSYDSTTQSLMLAVTHQLSPHVTLRLDETAGWFSQNFVPIGLSPTVPFDPSSNYVPTTDFFDNRTMYSSSHAELLYQRTARLSFRFGGDGVVIRRRSAALSSALGEGAQGDVAYRLSRRTTIGAGYTYNHYTFTRYFGGTDVQTAVAAYSIALSRWVEFSSYAGMGRVEYKTIQSVPVDPAIGALLGITAATQVYHATQYIPNVGARIAKTFKSGVAYASVGHGVTPGNGLFLTSYSTIVNGGYMYTGLRRWSFNSAVFYSRNDAVGSVTGQYGGIAGSLSAARQIAHSVHFTMTYSARQYESPNYSNYNRVISEFRAGLGFAPGDIPLRIW